MPDDRPTVNQRLAAIAASEWPIAFDGCHKIYFLPDIEREVEAVGLGYEIHPATSVEALYRDSCALRFVSKWGFDNSDFEHELNIEQFEVDQEGPDA